MSAGFDEGEIDAANRDRAHVLDRGRSTEHWFLFFAALMMPVALVLIALIFTPDERGFGTHEQLGISACMTLDLWGIPCPGCGVTTSVTLATHGRLLDSLKTQPLGLLLTIASVLFTLWSVWATARGKDLYASIMNQRLGRFGRALITVVLVSWLYKWITTGNS